MTKEDAIREAFIGESHDRRTQANVVDALFAIAEGLKDVAYALKYLGNGDAATSMGAIEALSVQIREGFSAVADAIMDGHE